VAAAAPDPGNLRINPAPDVAPGIVGRAEDGSVIVDNSLPVRLARRRPDLAIALLRRLEEATDAVG
jgi:vacuolar-type H+-ATPase subunit E/Vma4